MKKEYAISSGTGKNRTSQTVSSTLHLEGQARYFTVLDRHKIRLDKNKMDSKFIKSHQCSLERPHAVFWLKLILNSDQYPALSQQKQILTVLSTSYKKFIKTEQWRFVYSITLCLATCHQ